MVVSVCVFVREMNRELELIPEWFKANKLTLNIDKTYYYGVPSRSQKI